MLKILSFIYVIVSFFILYLKYNCSLTGSIMLPILILALTTSILCLLLHMNEKKREREKLNPFFLIIIQFLAYVFLFLCFKEFLLTYFR